MDIVQGNTNLVGGLDKMDLELRLALGTVGSNNGVIIVPDTTTSNKSSLKNIYTQFIILMVVIGTTVAGIVVYRKVFKFL